MIDDESDGNRAGTGAEQGAGQELGLIRYMESGAVDCIAKPDNGLGQSMLV